MSRCAIETGAYGPLGLQVGSCPRSSTTGGYTFESYAGDRSNHGQRALSETRTSLETYSLLRKAGKLSLQRRGVSSRHDYDACTRLCSHGSALYAYIHKLMHLASVAKLPSLDLSSSGRNAAVCMPPVAWMVRSGNAARSSASTTRRSIQDFTQQLSSTLNPPLSCLAREGSLSRLVQALRNAAGTARIDSRSFTLADDRGEKLKWFMLACSLEIAFQRADVCRGAHACACSCDSHLRTSPWL